MISSMILVCAVLASLASGVLVAYGILHTMFSLFRIHSRQVAAAKAASLADVTLRPISN